MVSLIDREKAKKSIALVLDRLRTETDPHVLSEYREVFKKEISLFRRSWAAAYLLMCFDQGGNRPASTRRSADSGGAQGGAVYQDRPGRNRKTSEYRSAGARHDSGQGRASDKNGDAHSRQYPLADEDSKCIFIIFGRNRRVFPREILGLIIAKTGVSRDDIGAIRILENYSFVQVRDTIVERIIESLNGCVFRGRTLAVNFAKTRKDEAENSEAPEQDDVFNDNGDDSGEPENSAESETESADLRNSDSPAARDDYSENKQD
jgi:hypothetical protein